MALLFSKSEDPPSFFLSYPLLSSAYMGTSPKFKQVRDPFNGSIRLIRNQRSVKRNGYDM